ncbi:MAG: amino acid ABC transporter substrate-binding protein [Desulfobacteraceae bacterium]|nr:amino acid ABC transporter substrate-binding protein [Desulfobacteraceae bacterium]
MDGYCGGWEAEGVIIPKWHIGIEFVTVSCLKGTIKEWKSQESLANKKVAWERGFGWDEVGIVTVKVKLHEFTKLEHAMKMLIRRRIDFILDYQQRTEKVVKELGISDQVEILPNIMKGPKYYMVFASTEKGKKLVEIWDKEMERLHKSGQLHKMYEQWGDSTY